MSLSEHTVNKFRRPAVLQLNIEGLAASKMNVLHHLAVQYEALIAKEINPTNIITKRAAKNREINLPLNNSFLRL